MKRKTLIGVLVLSFISFTVLAPSAFALDHQPCCGPESSCSQGLQRESCCAESGPAVPILPSSQPNLSPAPLVQAITFVNAPMLACASKAPRDVNDDLPSESSLFLLEEVFLI